MFKNEHLTDDQKARIKVKSWHKLSSSPLMNRFKLADDAALRALFIGYWPFVDGFPAVIQDTYESTGQFARHGKVLSGALREMESDERNHRALWLKSVEAAQISVQELYDTAPLPAVQRITQAMTERPALWQRLLDFVAVEIVAEGISVSFLESEAFRSRLGNKGTAWFKTHVVHPSDQTTHEELAYRAAVALMPTAPDGAAFDLIDHTVQETVDRFIAAAEASLRAHDALTPQH